MNRKDKTIKIYSINTESKTSIPFVEGGIKAGFPRLAQDYISKCPSREYRILLEYEHNTVAILCYYEEIYASCVTTCTAFAA